MHTKLNALLIAALSRTLAALETPGDLTAEERTHVIEDAGQLLAKLEAEPPAPIRVVIDLDGAVQQITADGPVQVLVLDQGLKGLLPRHDRVYRRDDEAIVIVPWLDPHLDVSWVGEVFAQHDAQCAASESPALAAGRAIHEHLEQVISEQGWNEDTLNELFLRRYLPANPRIARHFSNFLDEVVEAESEVETPPGQSYNDFEAAFGEPIQAPSGDLLQYEDVKDKDLKFVWSIVDGDDGNSMWLEPGFRVVNHQGYVLTSIPWVTGEESYRWDD